MLCLLDGNLWLAACILRRKSICPSIYRRHNYFKVSMKVIYSLFLLSSCFAQRISNLVDNESKCVSFFDLYLLPDNNFYPTSTNLHSISKLFCPCLFKWAADDIGGHFLWWDITIPVCVFPLTSESYILATAVAHTVWINLKHTSDQLWVLHLEVTARILQEV